MAYEVLARKYRPKSFSDVVGQDHVTSTLTNAIRESRVAHAYIFVGPRGTGKTTTARILAKCLNCEKGPTPTPCNECPACKDITGGTHLDVLEYDAASNTQVDKIREILETVYFAPSSGKFKIYIIDEVHMLSAGSFNALLKTLEEPPAHVKFIFATTEPQKVPATILSRCQRFDLRRIEAREIIGKLSEIAKIEKVDVAPEALEAIARGAEGGMRDAQSALDQLISFRGNTIVEEDVLAVFGLVSGRTLNAILAAVVEGNAPAVLRHIAELDRSGKDLHRLVHELLGLFRDLLVFMHTDGDATLVDASAAQASFLATQCSLTDAGKMFRVVEVLTETEGRIRGALSRRTLLETSLVKCCRAATLVSIDQVIRELKQLQAGPGHVPGSTPANPSPASAQKKTELSAVAAAPSGTSASAGVTSLSWSSVMEAVRSAAPLAARGLEGGYLAVEETGRIVIAVADPESAALRNVRNVKGIEKAISRTAGREVNIIFVKKDADAVPPVGSPPAEPPAKPPMAREGLKNHPAVRAALDILDGDVVRVQGAKTGDKK